MISSQSESSRLLPARASQEHGATEESVEVIRIPSNDSEEAPENPTAEIRQEGSVTQLTRRLRCLFRTLTSPIIPLATILAVALLWVLYAAFVLDLRKSCSRPLHGYAIISLVTVTYATFHSHVRNYLFSYSPERDGPPRPIAVRMYDQLYHTLCILYVYGGVTLIEACRRRRWKSYTTEMMLSTCWTRTKKRPKPMVIHALQHAPIFIKHYPFTSLHLNCLHSL